MTVKPELHRLMRLGSVDVVDELGVGFLGHPTIPSLKATTVPAASQVAAAKLCVISRALAVVPRLWRVGGSALSAVRRRYAATVVRSQRSVVGWYVGAVVCS